MKTLLTLGGLAVATVISIAAPSQAQPLTLSLNPATSIDSNIDASVLDGDTDGLLQDVRFRGHRGGFRGRGFRGRSFRGHRFHGQRFSRFRGHRGGFGNRKFNRFGGHHGRSFGRVRKFR